MKKIIAFANRKGGSGKTTSAVSVAARLAEYLRAEDGDKRVLLIDIDPQGNAAHALGVQTDGHCVSDMLIGHAGLKDVLIPCGESHPNLFIVPASDRLREATAQLIAMEVAGQFNRQQTFRMNTILSDTFTDYLPLFEYIIIDCPPTLGLLDNALYDFATDVVVPVKMAYLDTTGARMHLEDIVAARDNGANIRISYVLPTFFRSRELVTRTTYEQLRKAYGRLVATPIPQTTLIEQSQAVGQQTIFEYAPDSEAALAYDDLTRRILND